MKLLVEYIERIGAAISLYIWTGVMIKAFRADEHWFTLFLFALIFSANFLWVKRVWGNKCN